MATDNESLRESYEVRVCGMHPEVAVFVRNALKKQSRDDFALLLQNARSYLDESLSDASVGLLAGGALKTVVTIPQTDHDGIIIRFVTDPTDIDSKQMTYVHKKGLSAREREIAFKSLYKRNFTSPKGSS